MNSSSGDPCDLVLIDESEPVTDLHDDAVKEVQLWNLQDMLNRPEPGA
jgi:hypothetical protein